MRIGKLIRDHTWDLTAIMHPPRFSHLADICA